jgi:hypothetical protein
MLLLRFPISARNRMNNNIEAILLYAIGRGKEKAKRIREGNKMFLECVDFKLCTIVVLTCPFGPPGYN